MTGRLDGKVALVTGGAQGMGLASAQRIVSEGGRVVLADVAGDAAAAAARAIGNRAIAVTLDVAVWEQWAAATDRTVAAFGGIDVLVAAAGIGHLGRIEEIDLALHRRIIDVNQHGVFYGMRAVAPLMRARGGGSIVNISSIDGIVGVTRLTSYVASKFAVRGMTRSAALELGADGIRVNSIHPGIIDTPMVDAARARLGDVVARQPIPRMGTAAEIANLVLFLASDESSYCTGSEFVIDGGHIAGAIRDY